MSSPRDVRLPGFQDLFGHVPSPTAGPPAGPVRAPRSKARVNRNAPASPVTIYPPASSSHYQGYSSGDQQRNGIPKSPALHRQANATPSTSSPTRSTTASTYLPRSAVSTASPKSPIFPTTSSPTHVQYASRRSSFSSPELFASGLISSSPGDSSPFSSYSGSPHAGPSNAAHPYNYSYVPLALPSSPSLSSRAVSLSPFDIDAIPRSTPRRPRAPGRGKSAGQPHKTARDNEPPPFNLDPASFTILQNHMWLPRADTPTAMVCNWGRCGRVISTADGEIPSHLVNSHGLSQQHDADVTCRWVDESTGKVCGVAMTYHSARQHVLRHVVRVHRGACRKCRKTMKEKGGMKRHLKMCLRDASVGEMLEFGVVVVLPTPGSGSLQGACIIAPDQPDP